MKKFGVFIIGLAMLLMPSIGASANDVTRVEMEKTENVQKILATFFENDTLLMRNKSVRYKSWYLELEAFKQTSNVGQFVAAMQERKFEFARALVADDAESGNPTAQAYMGKISQLEHQTEEALRWAAMSAHNGSIFGLTLLAEILIFNYAEELKGFRLLKTASYSENPLSYLILGHMYQHGIGVMKNLSRAKLYYELAGNRTTFIGSSEIHPKERLRQIGNSTPTELQEGISCDSSNANSFCAQVRSLSGNWLCAESTIDNFTAAGESLKKQNIVRWDKSENAPTSAIGNLTPVHVAQAKRRGLTCGVSEASTTQIASTTTTQPNTPTSAELTASQKEAERLRQELAALKAQQEQQKQTISNDTQIPLITIASANTKDKQGVIRGRASDNVGVAEVTVDGNTIAVQSNGSFEYSTFVPATGLTVTVQATDMAGLSSKQTVSLQRNVNLASAAISFDRLNPIGKRTKQNNNALALIIGVSDYENTPAKAVFADADAIMFRDYASEKLGIPDSRIKTMVNDNADIRELLLSVKNWLSRSVKQNQSDVYIFFAGHGLASDDGSKMYLLPYDGAPELLDDTAILRDRLFSDVAAANPRSVTVFLDTCYSGTTRGTDMLIASRPIAIRALEQSIPDNFTVMTAAAGDQTAKPLEEAKHGMFSYFLMKGMEGEADADKNNEITAGELHSYVQSNVIQQSSGSQTPELQGDADRVLVRFQ